MSETYTTTYTGTYTEARARAVMLSVLADLLAFSDARLVSIEKAKQWMEDLLYLLNARVLNYFELQFYLTSTTRIGGYKYKLSDDGTLSENSGSGDIDPYDVPVGTTVRLFADIDYSKRNISDVKKYLARRGWGTNGTTLKGQEAYERAYSKDGYGLKRFKVTL